MIKSLLFTASLAILLANPSSAQYSNNHLLSGERLYPGDWIETRIIRFIIQYDCNLVLYEAGMKIWASGTNGSSQACFLTLQHDGNLVIYDLDNMALWTSNTDRENGNYILLVQKDRNVVIYGDPIWATGTNYGGSVGVATAARNGKVGGSGAKQNKVQEIGQIREVINYE